MNNLLLSLVECYNKSEGIVLLQVYDRSKSQNSCARTDIMLKRGSRIRRKPQSTSNSEKQQQQSSQQQHQQSSQHDTSSIPSMPSVPSSSAAAAAAAMMMMGMKQEDRNLSVRIQRKRNVFSIDLLL